MNERGNTGALLAFKPCFHVYDRNAAPVMRRPGCIPCLQIAESMSRLSTTLEDIGRGLDWRA